MTLQSFGNMSQEEARDRLGIPPEIVAQPVVDLGDLTYPGNASKLLSVNATEDGLEFRFLTGSNVTTALGYTPPPNTRTISTTAPLSGGGDLSADRTFSITASALTKSDDTNVTITLGGTPAMALLAGVSLTLGWTGVLAASRGGNGNGFFAVSGPATSTKTFTFPNASDTVACLGQANAFTKQVTINNTTVGQTGFVGGGQSGARIVADFNGGNLNFSDAATFLFRSNGGGTTFLTINSSAINATVDFQRSGTKVVGARKTGWATATGTATRTTFDTASVTLPQLAERLKALIDDLHGTAGHGLIGT